MVSDVSKEPSAFIFKGQEVFLDFVILVAASQEQGNQTPTQNTHYNPTAKRGINKNSTEIHGRQLIPNASMPQSHNNFNCSIYLSVAFSPRANHTDRAAAAGRRS